MAVVAHFAEDGGNCGRRRHRGEVLGEVGKRMSAKSGPASRREGAGEPFRNVWSLVSLQVFHCYTGYYRVPSGAASCIMYYTYYIILFINTYYVLSDPGPGYLRGVPSGLGLTDSRIYASF